MFLMCTPRSVDKAVYSKVSQSLWSNMNNLF
uniref:Uncharacterized protein n=1 Tax=Anguilla anguilla TaxID=7936 RepID=A0A0E9VEV8_ANGAN